LFSSIITNYRIPEKQKCIFIHSHKPPERKTGETTIRIEAVSFLDRLRHVSNQTELEALFSRALAELGFHGWAHQVIKTNTAGLDPPAILTTFPDAWYRHYVDNRYDLIDPVVLRGPQQLMPFQWSALSFGEDLTARQLEFFREAADVGVAEGIGIPVFGPAGSHAMVSMVTDLHARDTKRLLDAQGQLLQFLGLAFHNAVRDLSQNAATQLPVPYLTPRERECLLWYAQGKSMWDIARILRISRRTVVFHLQNVRFKLGASTTHHAIIRALQSRIIDP